MDKVAMYKDYIEKTAGVKFKDLKKNEVKLTPEERAEVMKRKAVWNFSGRGPSPAVWKSVDKAGKATYVTNTHRAFNTAPTLKGAIGRFHNFIKSTASENVDDSIEKIAEQKIPELEEAFSDPIEKKVAYMIATSHEYKKPNVNAALSFVKNYKWELSKEKVKNLQGIEKPVNEEKVADMAKNMKHVEPFIVVNQLHGIRPQTPGKKILIDGHHRKKACEKQEREEVPVYKGTYTGKAELPKSELKEKTAYHIINDAFEKLAFDKSKTYAVDFDGTIVSNAFPRIGTINQNMVQFMRKVKDKGGKNIIWTCRSGKYLDEAKKFLKDNDIPYDAINSNPDKDFGSRKIYADYYVDDRAINIKDITKTAYEIIDEAFEKIAAQKKDKSQTHVNKIMKSGERQTMLHITYTDKKGDTTGRMVEPYKLSGDSFWGFDPAKDGIRRFKVGQINGTKMTKVKFDPRWPIETGGYTLPKKEDESGQLHLMDIVKK